MCATYVAPVLLLIKSATPVRDASTLTANTSKKVAMTESVAPGLRAIVEVVNAQLLEISVDAAYGFLGPAAHVVGCL